MTTGHQDFRSTPPSYFLPGDASPSFHLTFGLYWKLLDMCSQFASGPSSLPSPSSGVPIVSKITFAFPSFSTLHTFFQESTALNWLISHLLLATLFSHLIFFYMIFPGFWSPRKIVVANPLRLVPIPMWAAPPSDGRIESELPVEIFSDDDDVD